MNRDVESFNSALYWFPRILAAGLPVPRTEFVRYDHRGAVTWLEGEERQSFKAPPIEEVTTAAKAIGFPVFIRTDLASAKHNGKIAYRANRPDQIERVLAATVEDNEMKFWLGPVSPKAFMVREWLQLDGAFDAFGGHLISKEFRYFASGNGVICHHYYWPEESIQFRPYGVNNGTKEPKRWREKLAGMARLQQATDENLSKIAKAAAAACSDHERWSVDLALDIHGRWWLTDMATMERSVHMAGCPNKLTDDEKGA